MSMWDYDEEGDPYPPNDSRQYRDPYASGSSDYHGGYGGHSHSHSDHSHHNHGHEGHGHSHVHMYDDDPYSYQGQRSQREDPASSRYNYGSRHESYVDLRNHQHDSHGQNHTRETYVTHTYPSNNATSRSPPQSAPARQNYGGNQGNDMSAGYEIRQEYVPPPPPPPAPAAAHGHEASRDLFTSDSVVNLTLDEIDALARTHRSRSWLVVLYAPWCRFCQAMEPNFERVARHLEQSSVYVGRFRADGDYKEYAKRYLQLEHFPTVLFFPKDSSNIVKYQSENREVDALLGFVHAFD